ncbi:MAG: winged helix-turn-helix domain-containing protein [Cytophagales bacterium]|nr:winged helix-turn-helix domain-containing protein [Cytophagales bacterium]
MTTANVTRPLSDFKKEKLIGLKGKKIEILRPEELQGISNSQ